VVIIITVYIYIVITVVVIIMIGYICNCDYSYELDPHIIHIAGLALILIPQCLQQALTECFPAASMNKYPNKDCNSVLVA